MKILLLGAPKSGKTKLAKKLAEQKQLKIYDGLDKKFIKKNDLALGEISDYRSDFIFVSEILTLENKNENTNYVITAGPFYSYCHFLYKASLTKDESKMFDYLWIMMTMSKIAMDSLWYDEIYYLPYKKEEDNFSFHMDRQIRISIKEFSLEKRVITVE